MVKNFIGRAVVVWVVFAALLIAVGVVASFAWLFERSLTVIIMVVVASLLALVLNPLVEKLAKRLPRWGAVILVYLGLVGLMAVLGILIVPLIVHQGQRFAEWIPTVKSKVIDQAQQYINWYKFQASDTMKDYINRGVNEANKFSRVVVEGILAVLKDAIVWTFRGFLILIISVYLLLDKDNLAAWVHRVTPVPHRLRLERLFTDLVGVLGGYIRGLAMMVVFVAIMVSMLLLFTGNPYWLFIGCIAGLLEVIPYFGAVAGAVPGVAMGFYQHGPGIGVVLIVGFIVINQVEGHVVAPLAMGHSLHLRPLTVLLSLLIGAEAKGMIGMVLAVPVVALLKVLGEHTWRYFHEPLPPDGQTLMDVAGGAIDSRSEDPGPNGQEHPPGLHSPQANHRTQIRRALRRSPLRRAPTRKP